MGLISRLFGRSATRNDAKQQAIAIATGRARRRDSFINRNTGTGTTRDKRTYTEYEARTVSDVEARELWKGNHIAARIIETRPRESFRRGITLKFEGNKDLVENVMTGLEDLKMLPKLTLAAKYENAYGGSAIFPVINDGQSLDLPLDRTRIRKISRLHVLEARELRPDRYYHDIEGEGYGTPETYILQPIHARGGAPARQQVIHASRLIVFPGERVSADHNDGSVTGWGDSVLTRPHEVLFDYGLGWSSIAPLLAGFAQGVLSMDGYAELMAADKDDLVERRLEMMDMTMSNLRSLVIDSKDKYTREQTPLSGAAELLDRLMTHMASASDHPVSILMGISPGGLNATGDMDIRAFYDRTDGHRVERYLPQMEELIALYLCSQESPTKGKEPEVWSAEFNPMMQPSEKETADTGYVIAQTDWGNIDRGIYSADEARKRYIGDTFSHHLQIDGSLPAAPTREEIELAESLRPQKALPPGDDPEIEIEPDDTNAPPRRDGRDLSWRGERQPTRAERKFAGIRDELVSHRNDGETEVDYLLRRRAELDAAGELSPGVAALFDDLIAAELIAPTEAAGS